MLWGEDRLFMSRRDYGTGILRTVESVSVLAPNPEVLDPLFSEYEDDAPDHLHRHAFGELPDLGDDSDDESDR